MPLPSRERPPWVLVSAGFHEQGGQSKANAALAEHLLRRGHPIHLVGHDIAERFLGRPGCTVHRAARPMGADLLGVLWLRRRGRAVARAVCARHPGARVVVNGGNCHWGDLNWVHYVHCGWRPSLRGLSLRASLKELIAGALFRRHERKALAAARLVLANSEQTRALLVGRLSLEPGKVRTVHLGSDPGWAPAGAAERAEARAWLGQPEGCPLVVFVGGLGHDERKGFDALWAAWQRLCGSPDWDADLLVVGGGATSAAWQARIAAAGLAGRVRLLGFTDRVRQVLAAADLLVSPVRYEPYGLNVQEAVCRGVPALVSARAGVVEQFPPELAEMVLPDPDDARDLAHRLRRWRADMAGWRLRFEPLGEELRERTWETMAAELVAVVEGQAMRSGALAHER
jgi:ribosomal protein S9